MKLKLPILGLLMPFAVGILAACGGDATATPTAPAVMTPEQAATAFTTALNSGDLAAFNDLLADDFVFTEVPGPGGTEKLTLTGKTAYLLRLAGLMENNTQLTISESVYEGDRSTGNYSVTADNLRAIGVDSVSGTFADNRRNGKLVNLDLVTDGPSLQKLGAALAPPPARELTAMVGAGRDTDAIMAFLPSRLTVRAGDTVTWILNTDEIHTVAFLSGAPVPELIVPIPGGGPADLMLSPVAAFPTRAPDAPVEVYSGEGVVNSGIMNPDSPTDTFSLTFDTPGEYQVICLIHPSKMKGRVTVVAPTQKDVPSQAAIDKQGEQQLAPLLAELEVVKQGGPPRVTQELGPDGATIWYVQAGGRGSARHVEAFEFIAKDITIQEGDAIVWNSPTLHTVTFHPGREAPEFLLPEPQPAGPPILRLNTEVLFVSKPSGDFDGTGYWNSGIIGLDAPFGANFSMTFSKAGIYDYICALHGDLGMEGTITVVERGQAGGLSNTIAFQDFGWDPDHQGATGSVTYKPLASSFVATVSVADLKPAHTYNLYVMDNDLTGATGLDATTYPFTTDDGGAATIHVAKTYKAAEGAPLPAFQVHFLVVDQNVDLTGDLPNPLGIAHPITLACSFPLGFLALNVPGAPQVSLNGDSVPLFNYGWAPGFAGGNGNVSYTGQNPSFEATVTVADLKPDYEYSVFMMSSALNGEKTITEMPLTTDASGAGALDISHVFDVPEGVPLPALQLHILVIDRSEALPDAPNPLGIENPIVLACLFPLGFIQF